TQNRSLQQRERFSFAPCHLVHRALPWRFVFAPAQDLRPMPESISGKMIVADFDHNFRLYRLPFAAAFCAPTTRTARRVAGKARRLAKRFKFAGQRLALLRLESGRESNVVKKSRAIVKSEQERADNVCPACITKTTSHAIRAPNLLDLQSCVPLAGSVRHIDSLRDNAVEIPANFVEPLLRLFEIDRGRR